MNDGTWRYVTVSESKEMSQGKAPASVEPARLDKDDEEWLKSR